MPAPVKVRFVSAGEKQVLAAFDTLEKRARNLANVQIREAQRAATESVRAARRAAPASAHGGGPYRGRSVAQDEAKHAQLVERNARRMEKIKERSALMAGRYAKQAADAEIREADRAARAIAKASAEADRKRQRSVGGRVNAVGKAGRSTLSTVGGVAGGIVATAGTYAVGSSLMSAMSLEEQAALLANSAGMGGIAPNQDRLMSDARGVATSTGFKAEDVMTAMGDVAAQAGGGKALAAFRSDLAEVSKTAKAAGVSIEEMGGVYAAAFKAGVKPGEEMQQLMLDLVAQGKAGAVEFADLARVLPQLAGAGLQTELRGADMIRRMSGLAQIAVEQKVSPEMARTSTEDLVRDITMGKKSMDLEKAGVKIFNDKGQTLDPAVIMANMMEKMTAGELTGPGGKKLKTGQALSYYFTGTSKAIGSAMLEEYQKAGGGEAGKKAVLDRINKASASGQMTVSDRDKEYERVMGTTKAKVDQEMEKFKVEISKLLPEFAKLLPDVAKAAQVFAKLAVWAGKNPFSALSGIFAAQLTKEIGTAQVGKLIGDGLTKSIASNKLTIGGVGAIAMTAATVWLVGKNIIDEQLGNFEEKQKGVRDATSDADRILRDGGTDEEKKAALEQLKKARAAANAEGVGTVTGVLGSLGAAVAGDDSLNPEKRAAKSDIEAGAAIQRLEAALVGNSDAQREQDAAVAKALSGAAEKLESAADKIEGSGGKDAPPRNTPMNKR